MVLLFLCGALNYGDRAATAAVFPLFRRDLHMSDVQLAVSSSVFLWTYALGSPFAGIVADTFSRRLIVVGSITAWSTVTLVTGYATGFREVLLTRAMMGLAECLYLPAAIALIADHHPAGTRALAMGIHVAGLGVGLVAGASAAGYLGQHYGWQAAFKVLGALGLIVSLVVFVCLRDANASGGRVASNLAWANVGRLFRVRTFVAMFLGAMSGAVANNIFLSWLPLYFHEVYGLSLGAAAFSGSFLLQFSSAIGAAAGGALSDRAARGDRRRRMLVQSLCYVATLPMLVAFLSPAGLSVVSAMLVGYGLLRSVGGANEAPMLCDLLPPAMRSTAVGLMNAGNTAAGGIGVLAAGALKGSWGLGAVFAGCSVVMLLSSALILAGYWWFASRDLDLADAKPRAGQAV